MPLHTCGPRVPRPGLQPQPSGGGQHLTVTCGPPRDQDHRTNTPHRTPTSPAEHGLKRNIRVGFALKVKGEELASQEVVLIIQVPASLTVQTVMSSGLEETSEDTRSFLQVNRGKPRERRGAGCGHTAGQQQSGGQNPAFSLRTHYGFIQPSV